jgi:hypothetical protein
MPASIISSVTTALWILIELIQFAYMACLMWKGRHNANNRNIQRARTVVASA